MVSNLAEAKTAYEAAGGVGPNLLTGDPKHPDAEWYWRRAAKLWAQRLEGIKRVVDRQAEDGALWAAELDGMAPIAEVYLQQALRLLHSVIEGDTAVDQALADMEDIVTEPGSRAGLRKAYVVFDGPPAPESGRFVEVEDENGRGLRAGEWKEREDGYWTLGPFLPVR